MNKFLLLLVCILASMTDVKIANIQIVELLMIAIILTSLLNFIIKGKYNLHHKLKVYVGQYFVFFLFLILLAVISFDQEFFIPPILANSLLQRPVIISLARFIQLFLVMMGSFILIRSFGLDKLSSEPIDINTSKKLGPLELRNFFIVEFIFFVLLEK